MYRRHPWLSEYEESFCCVPKHAGAGEGGLDYWTIQVPDAVRVGKNCIFITIKRVSLTTGDNVQISMEKINSSKWSKRKTGDGPPSWTSEIDGAFSRLQMVDYLCGLV